MLKELPDIVRSLELRIVICEKALVNNVSVVMSPEEDDEKNGYVHLGMLGSNTLKG